MQASAEMNASAGKTRGRCGNGIVWDGEQNPALGRGFVPKQSDTHPAIVAPGLRQGSSRAPSPKDGEIAIHSRIVPESGQNACVEWSLPPEMPWPRFLRMLRHPAPPRGWLEAAASLEDLKRRPLLLRWIAQHRKAPEALRSTLLSRLPWRALAAIAEDPSAHPVAQALATRRLQMLWTGMSVGERRSFAYRAPKALWPSIWKIRDQGVIQSFLQHPRLCLDPLCGLVQAPLMPTHVDALVHSRWREIEPLAMQVLLAMDQTFTRPDCSLVLGQAAPWIRILSAESCILAASRMKHPPLRRMTRAWAPFPASEDFTDDRATDD
jgi:hypothetical protein